MVKLKSSTKRKHKLKQKQKQKQSVNVNVHVDNSRRTKHSAKHKSSSDQQSQQAQQYFPMYVPQPTIIQQQPSNNSVGMETSNLILNRLAELTSKLNTGKQDETPKTMEEVLMTPIKPQNETISKPKMKKAPKARVILVEEDEMTTPPSTPAFSSMDNKKADTTPMGKVIGELKTVFGKPTNTEDIMNMNMMNQAKYDEKFKEYVNLKKQVLGKTTYRTTRNKLNTIQKIQIEIDKLLHQEEIKASQRKGFTAPKQSDAIIEDENTRLAFG